MYLGNAVAPQDSMKTSKMEQHIGNLQIKHIIDRNNSIMKIIRLRPYIKYRRPSGLQNLMIVSQYGVSHGGGDSVYGQWGSVCGFMI